MPLECLWQSKHKYKTPLLIISIETVIAILINRIVIIRIRIRVKSSGKGFCRILACMCTGCKPF